MISKETDAMNLESIANKIYVNISDRSNSYKTTNAIRFASFLGKKIFYMGPDFFPPFKEFEDISRARVYEWDEMLSILENWNKVEEPHTLILDDITCLQYDKDFYDKILSTHSESALIKLFESGPHNYIVVKTLSFYR